MATKAVIYTRSHRGRFGYGIGDFLIHTTAIGSVGAIIYGFIFGKVIIALIGITGFGTLAAWFYWFVLRPSPVGRKASRAGLPIKHTARRAKNGAIIPESMAQPAASVHSSRRAAMPQTSSPAILVTNCPTCNRVFRLGVDACAVTDETIASRFLSASSSYMSGTPESP